MGCHTVERIIAWSCSLSGTQAGVGSVLFGSFLNPGGCRRSETFCRPSCDITAQPQIDASMHSRLAKAPGYVSYSCMPAFLSTISWTHTPPSLKQTLCRLRVFPEKCLQCRSPVHLPTPGVTHNSSIHPSWTSASRPATCPPLSAFLFKLV